MIEFSSTDQEPVGRLLDDLGNGRVPRFAASGPDGDGEADELLGQGVWTGTRVEAAPGAIGETSGPPALEERRRRWRCAIAAAGGFGREAEEGPVLVAIEGAVKLVKQGSRGGLLFHEAPEDDEAAGAELAFLRGEAGADATQLLFESLALLLLQPGGFPLLGDNGSLEVFAALFEAVEAVLEGFSHGAIIARKAPRNSPVEEGGQGSPWSPTSEEGGRT